MAIIRCNKCGLLKEQSDTLIKSSIPCTRCDNPVLVYPTLFYIEKLLGKYFESEKELLQYRATSASVAKPSARMKHELINADLGNTDLFASEAQHKPIYDWFEEKQVKVQANINSVDTSGFFDEIAEAIGFNLPALKDVLDRIRWAQQKEHASTTVNLDKKTPEDVKAISAFCQQLYDYSFVAKCFHNKAENNIRLILQTAPNIRHFFNGEWLEWHALMFSIRYANERGREFSCARGLNISFQNGESYELDVFMLIDRKIPICIECKSGEFRQNIDRYLNLKKRLGISGKQFVMCIAGLADENAKAFSAMYDLTFVNERSLGEYLSRLF